MGRQESLISVENLAAVAGIDKAIRESEEVKTLEYLDCFCAARATRDLYRGDWFGMRSLSDVKDGEKPIVKEGDLFAVVGGARLYQPFLWIDCIAGLHELGYSQLLEDIPLEKAYEEADLDPESAWKAECFMRTSLNRSYRFAMKGESPIELPEKYLLEEELEESCYADEIPF